MHNKTLQLLGLAQRAGKIVHGEEAVLDLIKSGSAKLAFLACDTAPSTTKRILDKTASYQVRLIRTFSSAELSKAIGKEGRKVLAVADASFVKAIEASIVEQPA
jgi:ribosomal protein L7Ae-like RNA K-turn-binding protein